MSWMMVKVVTMRFGLASAGRTTVSKAVKANTALEKKERGIEWRKSEDVVMESEAG
jgi:hypothetical protein